MPPIPFARTLANGMGPTRAEWEHLFPVPSTTEELKYLNYQNKIALYFDISKEVLTFVTSKEQ